MSGQWEVVGKKKSKDASSRTEKNTISKIQKGTPRIEEVLPLQQVKNLYNINRNKENQQPQSKLKLHDNCEKKIQKKAQPGAKPKLFKSIESALNSISIEELQNVAEERKTLFPDAPLVWLKDIVKFLSQHIPVEISDHTFSSHPDGYPYSIVPTSVRKVIETSIKDAGKCNAQVFFDLLLTSLANDMSKNFHTVGHKIYIQYLATSEPTFAAVSLSKHVSLRTSYQNRPPIGLAILWSLGQVGLKDFNLGLQVFEEVMLPIIEMKNYSRYITKYLISLINRHNKVFISVDQYLLISDVIFGNYKNFPNDLKQDFQKILPKIEMLLLSNNRHKLYTYVDPLFKKLLSNSNKAYKEGICRILIRCLIEDQGAISSWTKLYSKCLPQSAILLNYMSERWNTVSNKFNRNILINLLNTFSALNEEILMGKRKEAGIYDCTSAVKKLKNKMVTKKKSKYFQYKLYVFILLTTAGGLLYYDINKHGTWQRTSTFNVLKDYGILQCFHKTMTKMIDGFKWIHLKVDQQFPGYNEIISEQIGPYRKLSNELLAVLLNIFNRFNKVICHKYPEILDFIEENAPGLIQQSQNAIKTVWSTVAFYFNTSMVYLKTEIFVGELTPENMQRIVLKAFNSTQQRAVEYYQWIYDKLNSKINY